MSVRAVLGIFAFVSVYRSLGDLIDPLCHAGITGALLNLEGVGYLLDGEIDEIVSGIGRVASIRFRSL